MPANRSFGFASGAAGALALAGVVAATFAGCNDIFNSKSCTSQGRLYPPGAAVPMDSGCGGCTCGDNGQIACPTVACVQTCNVEGKTYQLGEAIPSPGCNSCFCGPNGASTCTTQACLTDPACQLTEIYTYGYDGGLVAYRDLVTIGPFEAFHIERMSFAVEPADVQCVPELPACHDAAKIDSADIIVDLRHPDVQGALALATPPFYGHDSRPVDGVAFKLLRADGRGFLVGDACFADDACTPTPAGVQKLVDDLKSLEAQQLLDPTCASIPSRGAGIP